MRNTIPVIEEQLRVDKKVVETGKVHVSKKVTEHETSVSVPLMEETYDVERVPVNQVVETPPPPVRYEGDTMIIPVMREVLVVQKHYEIVEEIRLTKQINRQQHTEQVTLKKEEVQWTVRARMMMREITVKETINQQIKKTGGPMAQTVIGFFEDNLSAYKAVDGLTTRGILTNQIDISRKKKRL